MKKNALDKQFLVYYRAWRDVEMKGVNTTIEDENWLSMNDIPYGIDIVNVFSYVPEGEEEAAQPFFNRLKDEYVPNLHARGVKVIRGFDYSRLLNVAYEGDFPTEEEFDAHARYLLDELMLPWNLDGIDVDMEVFPTEDQINISDGVIKALSQYIGPKAANGTLFLYDTNGSNLDPFEHVSDCFDLLAYQQYGDGAARTERAVADYLPHFPKERFMPGSAFAEEMDRNRWYDTTLPYEESNLYQIANYAREHDLAGIFLYGIDRDGRTYEEPDFSSILPSSLLWTKTAILEVNG